MARRKPLDQLSPAYRRRIESGLARGLTYEEARGHKKQAPSKAQARKGTASKSEYRTRAERKYARQIKGLYVYRYENPVKAASDLVDAYGVVGAGKILKAQQDAVNAYEIRSPEYPDYGQILADLYRQYKRPDMLPYAEIQFHDVVGTTNLPEYATFLFYH